MVDHSDNRPHVATLLAIALAVLTLAGGVIGFFAKSDRDDIKSTATTAHAKATDNDKELAILRTELRAINARLETLETGQAEILRRLPRR